ncbi:MAG TPA: hypothetical protein VG204_21435 [Terriglobia bacterium]|nr:hypothetical protein [Terriglobia bacterium]
MRRLAIWLTLVTLAGVTSQPLLSEDSAAIRKQIEANYEKVKKATLAHSVEAVNECRKEIETADAIFIDSKGDIYPIRPVGQEYLSFAKSIVSYEHTIKKFTVSGNTADVWVDIKETRTEAAKRDARDTRVQERRVTSIEHTKDTWIKTPAGWRRSMREEVAPRDIKEEEESAAPPTTK